MDEFATRGELRRYRELLHRHRLHRYRLHSRQWASGFLVAYRSFFCPGGPHIGACGGPASLD